MLWENWTMAFATMLNDAAQEAVPELSASATAFLLTVHHWQPITLSETAEILGISQPTATRVADGLERAGHLKRGPKAGRQVPLSLTPSGERLAHEATIRRARTAHAALAALDLPSQAAFASAVRRMLETSTRTRRFARTTCRLCDHGLCTGEDCPVGSKARTLEQEHE